MMTSVWSGPATSVRQTSTSWPRAGSSPRPRGLRDGRATDRGLEAAGLTVLYDDRGRSARGEVQDSRLIGVPTIVVVGKSLENGVIEIKDRRPVTDVRSRLLTP